MSRPAGRPIGDFLLFAKISARVVQTRALKTRTINCKNKKGDRRKESVQFDPRPMPLGRLAGPLDRRVPPLGLGLFVVGQNKCTMRTPALPNNQPCGCFRESPSGDLLGEATSKLGDKGEMMMIFCKINYDSLRPRRAQRATEQTSATTTSKDDDDKTAPRWNKIN